MVSPRIFPMVPCGFPMVPCGFPMVLCHGAAIRRSPAQLCGLPYGAVRLPDACTSHLPDGAPFAAASSLRHQPIVASAALPLPCRSPGAAAVSPAQRQFLPRSAVGKHHLPSCSCAPARRQPHPAQICQSASQTGDLLRQMRFVAGRGRHREETC